VTGIDIDGPDFFTDNALLAEPYEYLAALRAKCPVLREKHHDVVMVTGYEESLEVYNDVDRFSSCISVTGPFPGFPVPLEGDDISGLTLMLLNAAANRDPREFADPDAFDADRENARFHFAFGRGVHICPGAALARTEARISLGQLLDRTTSIWIDEDFHGPASAREYHYTTFILRGLTRLHIGFTPA
jgi:cytochrome P450